MGGLFSRRKKQHKPVKTAISPPWSEVGTYSQDGWKRLAVRQGFEKVLHCSKKTERFHNINTWSTAYCVNFNVDKDNHQLRCVRHENVIQYQIEVGGFADELIQECDHISYLPSSPNHVAFLIKLSFAREVQNYVYIASGDKPVIFFLQLESGLCYQCSISPDETRIATLISKNSTENDITYDIQIYSRRPVAFDDDFQGNMFEIEYEIPNVRGCVGPPKLIFDPRFWSSRLGVVNVQSIQDFRLNTILQHIPWMSMLFSRLNMKHAHRRLNPANF